MADRILVFYGSYRSDGQGIRLAHYLIRALRERGAAAYEGWPPAERRGRARDGLLAARLTY
jgi:hypothetical protein